MSLFVGNRGAKLYKSEDENIISKFITRGTNKGNVWERRAIGRQIGGEQVNKDAPFPGRPSLT